MKLIRDKQRRQKKASLRSEKQGAAELKGRTVIGSGAINTMKGDIESDVLLCEDKWTAAKSFSVKKGILDKIKREAFQRNKLPALRVTVDKQDVYYVIERRVMLHLLET